MLGSLDRFHSLGLREICPNGGHVFAALHRSSPPCKHQWTMTPVWNNHFAMKLYVAREVYTVYFVYISGYITLVGIHRAYRLSVGHRTGSGPCTWCTQTSARSSGQMQQQTRNAIHPSISSSFTVNFHH